MNVGDHITLRLDSLAFGGEAVGRSTDGRVVFVAGGVPGDVVEVELQEVKKGHARGALMRVGTAGHDRVSAPCPLVGSCGGCQWQEVAASAQQSAKHAIVERALRKLGAETAPLVVATEQLAYRTRARMHVGDGAIGFAERKSSRIVDVEACLLLHPALESAMMRARATVGRELREGGELAGLLGIAGVHLAVTRAGPGALEHARRLVAEGHALGVLVDGTAVGAHEIDCGDEDGPPFWAAADGFAQASAAGNRVLRRVVASHFAGRPLRVLELHAGDGNFTRDLLALGHEVIAVEAAPRAAQRLARNAARATVVSAPAEDEAARRAVDGERFDAVLLDPPRAGARELMPSLATLTDRIVYVSCDPMTLARDAADLRTLGMHSRLATPIDLMPQTFHVETVMLLER